jgi:hypothetical protein
MGYRLNDLSLYPVFPVPTDLSYEVNLDVSHMDGLALTYDSDEPAPDVIVLPSRYKQFCKVSPSFEKLLVLQSVNVITDRRRYNSDKPIVCLQIDIRYHVSGCFHGLRRGDFEG